MFKLIKFSKEELWVNPEVIKHLEAGGDTIVTLMNGERLFVREKVEQIRRLFLEYKNEIYSGETLSSP